MSEMTIMVVDDETGIRKMLFRQLKKLNYEAVGADSGENALYILEKERIDLILLDQMMPEMDGIETFRQIQDKIVPYPPVIMITANDSTHLAVQFMKIGGADFAPKPLDFEVLNLKIQRALEYDRKKKVAEKMLAEGHALSSLSVMTASITHEMRQPLTGADMDLSAVVQGLEPGEMKDLVVSARTHMKDALLIIRSLMKVFRGNQKKVSAEVNINSELEEILHLFGGKLKGVGIVRDFADDAFIWTCGNISRIFVNLISNALDVLNNQGRLNLSTRPVDDNIEVIVEDNGAGIPPEILDKIFDMNFTTKKTGEGTGLGLWIAKREVEQIGGKISVESETGKFTKFIVVIPRNREDKEGNCN